MLNLTVMTGRMVETPELKTTANNVSVTVFRIAVSRNYKVNEEYPTDFFNVVAWRGTAEFSRPSTSKKATCFRFRGILRPVNIPIRTETAVRRSSL